MNKRIRKKRILSRADKKVINDMIEVLDHAIKCRFRLDMSNPSSWKVCEISKEEMNLRKLFYDHSSRKKFQKEIRETGKVPHLVVVFSTMRLFTEDNDIYEVTLNVKYPQIPCSNPHLYRKWCYSVLKAMFMLYVNARMYRIKFLITSESCPYVGYPIYNVISNPSSDVIESFMKDV